MTDFMRQAYEIAGESQYFFEKIVPRDLWRGQKEKEYKKGTFLLEPRTSNLEPKELNS